MTRQSRRTFLASASLLTLGAATKAVPMQNEKLISEHSTLDEIENLLDPGQFFRVNRQYLIHIQTIGGIKTTQKGLSVQLKPPFTIELEISREKATAFKKWMEA